MDYKKEFEKATETISVLDRSLSNEIEKNRALQCEFDKMRYENKRLKQENKRLKDAIVEKFLGVDLEGDEE